MLRTLVGFIILLQLLLAPSRVLCEELRVALRWVEYEIPHSTKLRDAVASDRKKSEDNFADTSRFVIRTIKRLDRQAVPTRNDIRLTRVVPTDTELQYSHTLRGITFKLDFSATRKPSGRYLVDANPQIEQSGRIQEYDAALHVDLGTRIGFCLGIQEQFSAKQPLRKRHTTSIVLLTLLLQKNKQIAPMARERPKIQRPTKP